MNLNYHCPYCNERSIPLAAVLYAFKPFYARCKNCHRKSRLDVNKILDIACKITAFFFATQAFPEYLTGIKSTAYFYIALSFCIFFIANFAGKFTKLDSA